jgi:hypothetical protein
MPTLMTLSAKNVLSASCHPFYVRASRVHTLARSDPAFGSLMPKQKKASRPADQPARQGTRAPAAAALRLRREWL